MNISETFNKPLTARFWVGAVSRCFSRFNYWWNKNSGQYYWFEVRYIYTKNGSRILDWVDKIGVRELKTTVNKRELKKIPQALHKDKRIKKYLCNGKFDVEIMCYLGRFSK